MLLTFDIGNTNIVIGVFKGDNLLHKWRLPSSNKKSAGGISIYFPERGMFNSYPKCNFAKTNAWSAMIVQYLISKK